MHKPAPASIKKKRIGKWLDVVAQQGQAGPSQPTNPKEYNIHVFNTAKEHSTIPATSGSESIYESINSLPELPSERKRKAQEMAYDIATRKRGRPVTVGNYTYKKEYKNIREKVALLKSIEDVNNPDILPGNETSLDKLEKQLSPTLEAIHNAPLVDNVSRILTETDSILKVADNSGNLKGGYIRALKKAVLLIRHSTTNISQRSQNRSVSRQDHETEKLRIELARSQAHSKHLQDMVESLRKDLDQIKSGKGNPLVLSPKPMESTHGTVSTPNTVKKRPQKRRKVTNRISSSSSQSSEVDTNEAPIKPPSPIYVLPQQQVQTSRQKITPLTSGIAQRQSIDPILPTSSHQTLENRITQARTLTAKEQLLSLAREKEDRTAKLIELTSRLYAMAQNCENESSLIENYTNLTDRNNVYNALSAIPTETAEDTEGRPQPKSKSRNKRKPRKTRIITNAALDHNQVRVWDYPPEICQVSYPAETRRNNSTPYNEITKRNLTSTQKPINVPTKFKPILNMAQKSQNTSQRKPMVRNRRVPRTAIVTLTCLDGEYANPLRKARTQVSPTQLGIHDIRVKRTITGAMAFEIRGPDSTMLANTLADELRKTFVEDRNARIARPVKLAEMHIRDLEASITAEEIAQAVASAGDCRVDEVRVGWNVRIMANGLGIAWIRCPLTAAMTIANEGTLRVGWSKARTELLPARPLQCFKCLEGGHVRANCKSTIDRSNICYRYGVAGHRARDCDEYPRCILCSEGGLPAQHRVGSTRCAPSHKVSGKGSRIFPSTRRVLRPREQPGISSMEVEPPVVEHEVGPQEQSSSLPTQILPQLPDSITITALHPQRTEVSNEQPTETETSTALDGRRDVAPAIQGSDQDPLQPRDR